MDRRDALTRFAAVAGSLALTGCAGASRPAASPARFVTWNDYPSRHVVPRQVVVWLPPGYDRSDARCQVLYMHDGHNLFDPALAMAHQPWAVDRHLAALIERGEVPPTIIVGIDHPPKRWQEYVPAAAVEALPAELQQVITPDGDPKPNSDRYLRFLVEELKPRIDREFRTLPDRAHTTVMGSSMGGLVSLYALCRHPDVFGGAGCLSTHWVMTTNFELLKHQDPRVPRFFEAYRQWLQTHLPPADGHRLYFDHGSVNLDALYGPYQQQIDALMAAEGYRQGIDWITHIEPGADHNEPAWRARLDLPLRFLLKA